MDLFLFTVFYNLLYFSGKGFSNTFLLRNLSPKSSIKNILYIFYPIISLFIIGNLTFLLNFFFPINDVLIVIYLFVAYFSLINLKKKPELNLKYLIINFLLPSLLSFAIFGSRLHYDAGAYHLNHQLWIKESKIVFGLSNVNISYGYSSIYEYISSLLWIQNDLIILQYLNLVFFVFYFGFLIHNIFFGSSKFLFSSSVSLLLFSFLDNFGYNGGGNGSLFLQTVGKPDVALSSLFLITCLIIFELIISNNFHKSEIIFISSMILFLIQLKVFGFYLLPLYFYILYKYFRHENITLRFYLLQNKTLFFLGLIWLVKSVINSGCIVFPLESLCFDNLSWYQYGEATAVLDYTLIDPIEMYLRANSELRIKWLSNEIFKQIYINFFFSLFMIFILNFILFKKKNFNQKFNYLIIYSFILFLTFSFLTTRPNPRFGIMVFGLLIILPSLRNFELRFKNNLFISNFVLIFLVFISVLLTPRFYSYNEILVNPALLTQRSNLYAPTPEYINNSYGWGYDVPGDLRCWINRECMYFEKNVFPVSINGYTIFYPDKSFFTK